MSVNQQPKILYIEDDALSRELISKILTAKGYEVLLAQNGLAGLRMAQAEYPDLILIDLGVTVLDGYEVATRLRSLPSLEFTPIVGLTANPQSDNRERAITAGCNGYIAKPINVKELPGQIEAYLFGQRDEVTDKQQNKYLKAYNQRLVKRLESTVVELETTNQELREAHRQLKKLDKVKSDFISLAAHELRTPISLVHGYAYLLLTENESGNVEPSKDILTSILNASGQLNKTVNDLINVSNVELGQIQLFLAPTSVDYLAHAALNELAPISQGRHLSIEIMDLNKLPMVKGDPQQLQQVFWNLLSNAVKFTPDDGYVHIYGKETKEGVEVIFEDTGVGINVENQEHIFGRFSVLDDVLNHSSSDTSFRGGGLGLGLYITKGIVEAHGGRIWVESEGHDEERCPGSRFHLLLPIADFPEEEDLEELSDLD